MPGAEAGCYDPSRNISKPMNANAIAPAAEGAAVPASEAERYAAAWRERRRRMYVYIAELHSFWILMVLPLPLAYFGVHITFWYLAVYPIWFVGNIAAGVYVNRFRCPRCRGFFYWSWKLRRRASRRSCRQCGLAQGEMPAA